MNAIRSLGAATLTMLAILGTAYLTLSGAAVASLIEVFIVGAVVCYAMDLGIQVWAPELTSRLSRFRIGATTRSLIRQALLLGLLGGVGLADTGGFGWIVSGMVALFLLQTGYDFLLRRISRLRRLPVVTRNIDLSGLGISDGPPRWLAGSAMNRFLLLDAPLVAGGIGFALTNSPAVAGAGAAASVGIMLLLVAALFPHYLRALRMPTPERVLRYLQEWLDAYRPEVLLYLSGSPDSAYQVNMWLEPLRHISRRPLILLRERPIADQLGTTTIPSICVPAATDVMALDFEPARVALYPANTGKNIHLLRAPTLRHVFIGHGDSDKIASVNPYSKVYDEVWTAGRAGRDRYRLARVGVRDDEIVEVGRPQLSGIGRHGTAARATRTVLYAPTWEGWTDEPGNTSLIEAGPTLIARLLEADPAVRVIYKPHPYTGTRAPEALRAHRKIVALLETANRRAGRSPAGEGTAARLAELERAFAAAETTWEEADEAQRSRDQGDPASAAHTAERLGRMEEEWHRLYWDSHDSREHLVVQGRRPTLFSCFDHADLLISDISSVVSDFIHTTKPYAITNCEGISDTEFRTKHPSSGAAFLLRPDGTGLEAALAAIHDPAADGFAEERQNLKTYLLGPDEPDAQTRFDSAVEDLYQRAAAELPLRDGAGERPEADADMPSLTVANATVTQSKEPETR